jgi:hypothetical protein
VRDDLLAGDWVWEKLCPTVLDRLRKIFADLDERYNPPSDNDMAVLAAAVTGMQFLDLPPEQEFPVWGIDVLGRELRAPLWPNGKLPFDWNERGFGHPRYRPTTWHDLVSEEQANGTRRLAPPFQSCPDLIGRLRKTMAPTNPGAVLDNSFIADFLEKVIPHVTGETPSALTIWQWLRQPHKRKRGRRRIHP